jgi:hypothetical protein
MIVDEVQADVPSREVNRLRAISGVVGPAALDYFDVEPPSFIYIEKDFLEATHSFLFPRTSKPTCNKARLLVARQDVAE